MRLIRNRQQVDDLSCTWWAPLIRGTLPAGIRKVRILFLLVSIASGANGRELGAGSGPYLLYFGWGNHRPPYLLAHSRWIDALPIDGIVIGSRTAYEVMARPVPENVMQHEFSPLDPSPFVRVRRNFAVIQWGDSEPTSFGRVPDLFDNWDFVLNNLKIFGRLCRKLGLAGVMIDNESYGYSYWHFPADVKYPERGLQAYHGQARLRGRQVMAALKVEGGGLDVIVLHGPYSSVPENRQALRIWSSPSSLIGSFAAGVLESGDRSARGFDGGELYDLHTADQFRAAYQFRKNALALAAVGAPFMDESLRRVWAQVCNISFGVWDKEPPVGEGMGGGEWVPVRDLGKFGARIANALRFSDGYAWIYGTSFDLLADPEGRFVVGAPGPVPPSWIETIRRARDAARPSGND